MSDYILILHKRPGVFETVSRGRLREILDEFAAWRTALIGEGKFVGGSKLKENGFRSLSSEGSKVVESPFESSELISGLFTIRADDYNEALRIASSCPPLKFGARIEVREIDQAP